MSRSRVRRHSSQQLFDGGFAYSAEVDCGATLFTAGISPLDADGQIVAPDEPVMQTEYALAHLHTVLRERGATRDDIAKLTLYVPTADRADLAATWTAVDAVFGSDTPPAVIVAVTVLPYPGQRVEVDAVVAL